MTEGSDFKIGNLVGFAEVRHKFLPRKKTGLCAGLGELPKFKVFPLIFVQWLKVSTSNLVHSFCANQAHHNITQMTNECLAHGMIHSLQN